MVSNTLVILGLDEKRIEVLFFRLGRLPCKYWFSIYSYHDASKRVEEYRYIGVGYILNMHAT